MPAKQTREKHTHTRTQTVTHRQGQAGKHPVMGRRESMLRMPSHRPLPTQSTHRTASPTDPRGAYLVEVEHQVQFTHVAEVSVQQLHKHVDGLQQQQLVVGHVHDLKLRNVFSCLEMISG